MFTKQFQHLDGIERKRISMPDNVTMRLNRLEKPEPWGSDLLREKIANFDFDCFQQYPNYQPFYEHLAEFVGCEVDELVIGAGIEEFIRNLFMLCVEPGDKVAYLWPTCAMFDVYSQVFGAEPVKIVAYPGPSPTVDEIKASLPGDLKLFILTNPGQPVETCFSEVAIRRIANICAARGAVLAIDEAYYGFGAPTFVRDIKDFDNVVVLRTFSKMFGAASIRLGCAVGKGRVINALNAVRQSGEVSAFSMHAASVMMSNYGACIQPAIKDICDGRNWLRDTVQEELGLKAWGRYANHVLIEVPNADEVAGRLADKGIMVKAGFPAPVDRHILVTCGSRDLMTTFCAELMAVL